MFSENTIPFGFGKVELTDDMINEAWPIVGS